MDFDCDRGEDENAEVLQSNSAHVEMNMHHLGEHRVPRADQHISSQLRQERQDVQQRKVFVILMPLILHIFCSGMKKYPILPRSMELKAFIHTELKEHVSRRQLQRLRFVDSWC